jgi:hypothetical protein
VTGSAGTFFFAPPATAHTFANFSGRDARMLVLCPRRVRNVLRSARRRPARIATSGPGPGRRSPDQPKPGPSRSLTCI